MRPVRASRCCADAGRLDILVNNAGVGHVGTSVQTDGADLDRLYAVNVRGVFNVSKAFLPSMLQRRAGIIINMASVGGVVGIRDRLAYCTSKFAVVGLTKSMALDHALDGIRINCICPGRVETPLVAKRLAEYPDPEQARREMTAIAGRRPHGPARGNRRGGAVSRQRRIRVRHRIGVDDRRRLERRQVTARCRVDRCASRWWAGRCTTRSYDAIPGVRARRRNLRVEIVAQAAASRAERVREATRSNRARRSM